MQHHWTPEKAHAADLDQLARQMGRPEENRAASQFFPVALPPPPASPEDAPIKRYSPLMQREVGEFDLIHERTIRQAATDRRPATGGEARPDGRFERMHALMDHAPDASGHWKKQPEVDIINKSSSHKNEPENTIMKPGSGIDP